MIQVKVRVHILLLFTLREPEALGRGGNTASLKQAGRYALKVHPQTQ